MEKRSKAADAYRECGRSTPWTDSRLPQHGMLGKLTKPLAWLISVDFEVGLPVES